MITEHGLVTRKGRRMRNEDAGLVLPDCGLFAVSDGMGGLDAGDVASQLAIDTLRDGGGEVDTLRAAIAREGRPSDKIALSDRMGALAQAANEAIWDYSQERRGRMGATLTAAVVAGEALFLAHTGDSRAYLVRGGRTHLLTSDTTVAAVRLRAGKITADQYQSSPYRNALADALGITATVRMEFQEVALTDGDVLVLCSDGVWEVLGEAAIAAAGLPDPRQAARALVDSAFDAGSDDNLTAVVVRFRSPLELDKEPEAARPARPVQLTGVPLFADLDDAELRRLAPFLQERSYRTGQVVVSEGDPGEELLVLLEGSLEVSRRGVSLTRIGVGQSFGEIALARSGPRMATITAIEGSRVLAMHRTQLNDLIERQPALGARLVVRLMRQLADWLVELTDRVTEEG